MAQDPPKTTQTTVGPAFPTSPDMLFGMALIAFGQGTGGMAVTQKAVETLMTAYLPQFQAKPEAWSGDLLSLLECARHLGRHAAYLALAHASPRIEDDDVKAALAAAASTIAASAVQPQKVAFALTTAPTTTGTGDIEGGPTIQCPNC